MKLEPECHNLPMALFVLGAHNTSSAEGSEPQTSHYPDIQGQIDILIESRECSKDSCSFHLLRSKHSGQQGFRVIKRSRFFCKVHMEGQNWRGWFFCTNVAQIRGCV